MAFLVAVFFGFVPMFLFAAFVNWLDRYEKEPKILLGAAFVWGMVIAAGGAFVLNTAFGVGLYAVTGSEGVAEFGTTSIVAPIIEELLDEQETVENKATYYQGLIDGILSTGSARIFIVHLAELIQKQPRVRDVLQKYSEMRLANLSGAGGAIRELKL